MTKPSITIMQNPDPDREHICANEKGGKRCDICFGSIAAKEVVRILRMYADVIECGDMEPSRAMILFDEPNSVAQAGFEEIDEDAVEALISAWNALL